MKKTPVIDKTNVSFLHGNGESMFSRCEVDSINCFRLYIRQLGDTSAPPISRMSYEKPTRKVEDDLAIMEV
jgi:hypothetical protein